jgi:hypothetical protein
VSAAGGPGVGRHAGPPPEAHNAYYDTLVPKVCSGFRNGCGGATVWAHWRRIPLGSIHCGLFRDSMTRPGSAPSPHPPALPVAASVLPVDELLRRLLTDPQRLRDRGQGGAPGRLVAETDSKSSSLLIHRYLRNAPATNRRRRWRLRRVQRRRVQPDNAGALSDVRWKRMVCGGRPVLRG